MLNSHSNDDLSNGMGEVVAVVQTEDVPNIELTAQNMDNLDTFTSKTYFPHNYLPTL